MPILVANIINVVTLAFIPIAYEWVARRLARKIAPQPLAYARKLRVWLICAVPFLAWSVYVSVQPWNGYSMAFLLLVAFPLLMLYVIIRWIIVIARRRRRRSAARAEALMKAGGER